MKSPIHILQLEDDPIDASLIQATLEADGVACTATWVQNRDDFVAALEHGSIDLILADYSLPAFDGLSALKLVRAKWPAIPLILVSGTIGEDRAVDALKNGATDYIMKERMGRLAPAVRRAMREVQERAERLRLEAQFIEAQKMEVIGQLAGGVAHDFNNFLAIIMGYSELSMQTDGQTEVMKGYMETIRSTAERATGLTRQLLIFSRHQTVQAIVMDLNEVVKDLDKMLRRLIDEHIEMTIVLGEGIGRIKADSGYVGQVLMNLVVNARDAMPHGGKLTIATNNATLDANYAQEHKGVKPGNYVMFSVSDTGVGMTEEVKTHMFEAFFTTKPKGKGTGLGLATCQTIVQQSDGHIVVHSHVGQGTTFKIYFPRVDQQVDIAATRTHTGALPRGTETVLVVEDEPSLRQLARRVLETHGYKVFAASNGQEALEMTRDHIDSPFQMVITDVIMPMMNGKVMAEWLKAAKPDLKILFTSGYTDEIITCQGVFEKGVDFLPKPYTPAMLIRKVREMLDAPR